MKFVDIMLITFLCLIFLLYIFFIIEVATEKDLGQKEVPCYDKNNNLILNQTCLENVTGCGAIQNLINTCKDNFPIDYPSDFAKDKLGEQGKC